MGLIGPVALFGIYIVTHGQVSPGGGFQGGVILATAPLLIYLAGEFETLRRIAPHWLAEVSEAVGAGGYILIGLIGTLAGEPFLTNVLPFGKAGEVTSGGIVPLINLTVGLEVSAGFLLLLMLFLEEALSERSPHDAPALFRGRLAVPRGPVRHRHQPQPGAPGDLPGGGAIVELRAAAGHRIPDGRGGAGVRGYSSGHAARWTRWCRRSCSRTWWWR